MELVVGSHEVVSRILALPVFVAAEVVPKEAYTLHIGEEFDRIRQILYLHACQEELALDR